VARSCAKVLIVEDEGLIAFDIRTRLEKLGYIVTGVCASSDEVFRAIAADVPELILMDIRIKGDIDGIDVSRRVQIQYDVPVVFLTAHSDPKTIERVKEAGPYGYVSKPFHGMSLATTIDIAVSKHRAERELRRQRGLLTTILGNMAEAVIVTDQGGNVQFMNPVAEALSGWSTGEARGKPFHDVLPIEDLDAKLAVDDLIQDVLLHQHDSRIPLGLHGFSRLHGYFRIEGDIALAPDGMLGCIVTFRDISTRMAEDEPALIWISPFQTDLSCGNAQDAAGAPRPFECS
jgi:two-component system, cell cycle sensor histidine kinase and response regulator CckA